MWNPTVHSRKPHPNFLPRELRFGSSRLSRDRQIFFCKVSASKYFRPYRADGPCSEYSALSSWWGNANDDAPRDELALAGQPFCAETSSRPGAAHRPAGSSLLPPGPEAAAGQPGICSEPRPHWLASHSHVDFRMLLPVRALDPFPAPVARDGSPEVICQHGSSGSKFLHAPGSRRVARSTSEHRS